MIERRSFTQAIYRGFWVAWLWLLIQQIVDVARFDAPWPVWVLRALPLVIFAPSIARDNLRSFIWLCFVLLFYFISAVELIFARPTDPIAIAGVVFVVAVFAFAVTYIRLRGPELRAATSAQTNAADGDHPAAKPTKETDS